MTVANRGFFVCTFKFLPDVDCSELGAWISDMIVAHAGIRVSLVTGVSLLGIFVKCEEDADTVRIVIDTNRADWYGSGVSEIRLAA